MPLAHPARALWRCGAAGDAHSLVAAARAHGGVSALHPRRDHPLRASLRKLGGDACLTAPLVCGHAVACCGCARAVACAFRPASPPAPQVALSRCLRAGRLPPPSGVPPLDSGEVIEASCLRQLAPLSALLTATGYTRPPPPPTSTCSLRADARPYRDRRPRLGCRRLTSNGRDRATRTSHPHTRPHTHTDFEGSRLRAAKIPNHRSSRGQPP